MTCLNGEVFVEVPLLRIDAGGADTSIVNVNVRREDEVEISKKLSELVSADNQFDLNDFFSTDGEYRVSVIGPLGLRMAAKHPLSKKEKPRCSDFSDSVSNLLNANNGLFPKNARSTSSSPSSFKSVKS